MAIPASPSSRSTLCHSTLAPPKKLASKRKRAKVHAMKPQRKTSFHVLGRVFLSTVAVLVLATVPMRASDNNPVSAAILNKLDPELALVVKKSRGETPITQEPDVYKRGGRVLVEIHGAFSRELSDRIGSLGGQVVVGWGTTTTFRAWVPFAQLETLVSRADVRFISAARPSVTRRAQHP